MEKQLKTELWSQVKIIWEKTVPLINKLKEKYKAFWKKHNFCWWQVVIDALFVIVFLYYPIGAWKIHNIDTSDVKEYRKDSHKFASLDMAAYLINREVYYKLWTPNLPIVFPSYFLDDMPSFQLGLMSGVAKYVKTFAEIPLIGENADVVNDLSEGSELLQYSGKVWLFSPDDKLRPAPSSASQYKKGRKLLNEFNENVSKKNVSDAINAKNLSNILIKIKKDISRTVKKNEQHIREKSLDFWDIKSDDKFFFIQGKLYAYMQILKAAGIDFKDVLIEQDVYKDWTCVLKYLQNAGELKPMMVRNAKLDSATAPNHLITIGYFAERANYKLNEIIRILSKAEVKDNDRNSSNSR